MIKKYSLIIMFFLLIINLYSNVVKIEKIAVVNLDILLSSVLNDKSLKSLKNFNMEKAQFQVELDKIKDNIKKLEESLNDQTTDQLKKDNINKKIDELKVNYTNYSKKKTDELHEKKKELSGKIMEEVSNVVKKIAVTEGFSIVLNYNSDLILYCSIDNDITDKVIEYLNKDN